MRTKFEMQLKVDFKTENERTDHKFKSLEESLSALIEIENGKLIKRCITTIEETRSNMQIHDEAMSNLKTRAHNLNTHIVRQNITLTSLTSTVKEVEESLVELNNSYKGCSHSSEISEGGLCECKCRSTTPGVEKPSSPATTGRKQIETNSELYGQRLHIIALNEPHDGRLRGITGADKLCHREARQAGMNGDYRAFLYSSDQNLDDLGSYRIDGNIPIVNLKDEVLFNSWNNLLNGADTPYNHNTPIYSFQGDNVIDWTTKVFWHGSDKRGKMIDDKSCRGWKSNSQYAEGYASSLMKGKMIKVLTYSCNSTMIVLCIEIASQTSL